MITIQTPKSRREQQVENTTAVAQHVINTGIKHAVAGIFGIIDGGVAAYKSYRHHAK